MKSTPIPLKTVRPLVFKVRKYYYFSNINVKYFFVHCIISVVETNKVINTSEISFWLFQKNLFLITENNFFHIFLYIWGY